MCARLPNLEHLAVAIPEVHGENVEQALTQLERLRSLSLIILKDNDDDETPIRTPNVQERQERVFIELASRGQLEVGSRFSNSDITPSLFSTSTQTWR